MKLTLIDSYLNKSINDLYSKLGNGHDKIGVYETRSWIQGFANGSTLFGGPGGSVCTQGLILVFLMEDFSAYIYSNGSFVSKIERPNEKFYKHLDNRELNKKSGHKKYEKTDANS